MSAIPLEDGPKDVIAKAMHGLGMGKQEVAARAEVSIEDLKALDTGRIDEAVVRKIAPVLGLRAEELLALGNGGWHPKDPGPTPGLACFTTQYGDGISVNSYLVWDPNSDNGACVDTGADAAPMMQFASDRRIRIQMVLLTHTHPDHIADLERLKNLTEAAAFVSKLEPVAGAETFEAGRYFPLGKLLITTRQTSGHSRGGITYVVQGLPRRVAFVGDALFAGSMGGGMFSYEEALRTNRERILSLPDDTILCPGHGPLTSVGEEKLHNPFFPEFERAAERVLEPSRSESRL